MLEDRGKKDGVREDRLIGGWSVGGQIIGGLSVRGQSKEGWSVGG